MVTIRYQVLSYQPYAFSGEWVAVGFLAYSAEQRKLHFEKAPRFDRVTGLFPNADVEALRDLYLPHLAKITRQLGKAYPQSEEIPFSKLPSELASLSRKIIPKNNNALNWRAEEVMRGSDFEWLIDQLGQRLFDQHRQVASVSPSDDEVWRKQFKPLLSEEVVRFEQNYDIEYRERNFHFDYGFQNGSLHLIDPTSFLLAKDSSVTRKLDRRYGKYAQLAKAFPNRQYQVYVPAALPENNKQQRLIRNTLEQDLIQNNLSVQIFEKSEIEKFKVLLGKVLE